MARFQHKKQPNTRNLWLSVLIFAGILLLFYTGVTSISRISLKEQEKSLKTALSQAVVRCYAAEGSYPESLEYLKEHYGITYDSSRFYVDYQVTGANILPDITVISRQE
ncbi:hypothetical protein C3B58_16505 [Lactonifactor longoviformis]|uniref:Type II secretory pathway, pseudopilin PulG n=1 Tax=Lactonifactor longoviformis DSM 17459 TaxID=1122155 RepID=A0A1M4UEH0_9CLOT|nr:hypothetical protein [Lactonifactor longoviformis]POP31423.1 hypothetical protein C3B58_16505 [Lactonifactor longoviformis]SHE54960.1 hypothetical protein SAMN02745158_00872 [Lactonifactor longoviformis DSM 17459]